MDILDIFLTGQLGHWVSYLLYIYPLSSVGLLLPPSLFLLSGYLIGYSSSSFCKNFQSGCDSKWASRPPLAQIKLRLNADFLRAFVLCDVGISPELLVRNGLRHSTVQPTQFPFLLSFPREMSLHALSPDSLFTPPRFFCSKRFYPCSGTQI